MWPSSTATAAPLVFVDLDSIIAVQAEFIGFPSATSEMNASDPELNQEQGVNRSQEAHFDCEEFIGQDRVSVVIHQMTPARRDASTRCFWDVVSLQHAKDRS